MDCFLSCLICRRRKKGSEKRKRRGRRRRERRKKENVKRKKQRNKREKENMKRRKERNGLRRMSQSLRILRTVMVGRTGRGKKIKIESTGNVITVQWMMEALKKMRKRNPKDHGGTAVTTRNLGRYVYIFDHFLPNSQGFIVYIRISNAS